MARITGSRFDAGRSFDRVKWPNGIPFKMNRLSFNDQATKRPGMFVNVPLTAYVQLEAKGRLRFLRAEDLLIDGRFNSKTPAVAAAKAFEIVTPEGIVLNDPSVLDGLKPIEVDIYLADVDQLHRIVAEPANIPAPSVEDMIVSDELGIRIPKTLVTGGQITALVELLGREGIEAISMHNIEILLAATGEVSLADNGIGNVSLLDGEKLAEIINEQNVDRHFRQPKDERELLAIFQLLKKELTSEQWAKFEEYWIWVNKETKEGRGKFVLRRPDTDDRDDYHPGIRFVNFAVLLVEDLN